jgi:hypothetical protein
MRFFNDTALWHIAMPVKGAVHRIMSRLGRLIKWHVTWGILVPVVRSAHGI